MKQHRHHGGNVWQAASSQPVDMIDFSANINPLGLSPRAQAAMIEAIPQLVHYPDPFCQRLRACLAAQAHVSAEQVLVGNGAVELIFLLVKYLRPQRVLLPAPTFSEYALAAQAEGIPVEHLLPAGSEPYHQLDRLIQAVQPGDLVFLCNPNNPTGQLYTRHEIACLAGQCHACGANLVVDEAFVDFTVDPKSVDSTALLPRHPGLFILRSLTKFFALPGIRIGYLLGEAESLRSMALLRDPWSVNHLAQVAAVASLEDGTYIMKTRQWIAAERVFLDRELAGIGGLRPLPPSANYILVDCHSSSLTATELSLRLRSEGILIRDCQSYIGLDGYWFRVAVKDRPANIRLLQALRRQLNA